MKKRLIFTLLLAISVFCLCSCATTKKESAIIRLQMSKEAAALKEKYHKADLKESFKKENFAQTIAKVYKEDKSEVLLDYKFKNKLSSNKSYGNVVYEIGNDNAENIVLYVHGGAWVYGAEVEHLEFCDRLATALNAKAYLPLYPLAPYKTFETTYDYLNKIYADLLKQGKKIFIMGDSAGGNIVLSFSVQLRDKGIKLPDKMVLLSPCVDMTLSNPDIAAIYQEKDPMLECYGCQECAKLWAGKTDLKDTRLSPINANLKGIEDTLLIVASDEIVYPDAMLFRDKMIKSKNNILTVIGEGYWHVLSLSKSRTPEETQTIDIIRDFVSR